PSVSALHPCIGYVRAIDPRLALYRLTRQKRREQAVTAPSGVVSTGRVCGMEGYITRRPRMRRRRLLSIWYAGYSLNRFGMHQFQSSVSLSEDTLVDLLKRAQQDSDPSAF